MFKLTASTVPSCPTNLVYFAALTVPSSNISPLESFAISILKDSLFTVALSNVKLPFVSRVISSPILPLNYVNEELFATVTLFWPVVSFP